MKNWEWDRRSRIVHRLEPTWDCNVFLFSSFKYVWLFFVNCWLRILVLVGFILKFSLWTEVFFFKGLTPCYDYYDYWSFWRCKGVKLPFFPHSISPWAYFKDFRFFWGFGWLFLEFRKWVGSWLWIGWFFRLMVVLFVFG